MIVHTKKIELTQEQEEAMYWKQLRFNSHKWIEVRDNYYVCDFCGIIHSSQILLKLPICEKNINLKH
jgi:hypothetical protein